MKAVAIAATVICMSLGSAGFAAAAVPVEQALELCRAEQNALKRLLCYDAISATGQQQAAAAPASGNTDKPVAATPANTDKTNIRNAEEEFGMEHKQSLEDAPDKLYVTVAKVSYSPHKSLIVEFENGQRWRQLGTEYYKISEGEQHYLKRGVLNSFFLSSDSSNKSIRVKRDQ